MYIYIYTHTHIMHAYIHTYYIHMYIHTFQGLTRLGGYYYPYMCIIFKYCDSYFNISF
jgi:hypothetical protein